MSEELLFRILHKTMEIVCFSANVCQCKVPITDTVVHVQLCLKYFLFSIKFQFLLIKVAAN